MSEQQGTSWLKRGCLGCLGLVGLCLVVLVAVGGLAWLKARSVHPEDQVVTREPPTAQSGAPEGTPVPAPAPTSAPAGAGAVPVPPAASRPGRVVLELSEAEFEIRPGEPGQPIRVEAHYDRNAYALDEGLENAGTSSEGADWIYRVRFHRTASGLFDSLKELFAHSKPRVRILLPRDTSMALEARVARGSAEIELGGLHLTSADVEVSMGSLELRVGQPLAAPMDSFRLRTSMGGAELRSLGNASPRKLDVEYSMGGMELDLRGQWVADSDISIRGSMGGGEVRLPQDVRVEGLAGHSFTGSQQGEVARPTLRFSASSSMGDLEFK